MYLTTRGLQLVTRLMQHINWIFKKKKIAHGRVMPLLSLGSPCPSILTLLPQHVLPPSLYPLPLSLASLLPAKLMRTCLCQQSMRTHYTAWRVCHGGHHFYYQGLK